MSQVFKVKNSVEPGKVPTADDLATAELAVNLKDQKLYTKDADGNVFEIGAASGGCDNPIKPPVVLSPHGCSGSGGSVSGEIKLLSGKIAASEPMDDGSTQTVVLENFGAADSILGLGTSVRITDGSKGSDGSYEDLNFGPVLNAVTAVEAVASGTKLTFTGTAADDNKDLRFVMPGMSIAGAKTSAEAKWQCICGGNGLWVLASNQITHVQWGTDSDKDWYRGKPAYLVHNGEKQMMNRLMKVTYGVGVDGVGKFVAINGSLIYYSTDGEHWYEAFQTTGDPFGDLIFDNGMWWAARTNSVNNKQFRSYDGTTWTDIGSNIRAMAIAAYNGTYYYINHNNAVFQSTDQVNWSTASGNYSITPKHVYAGTDETGRELVFLTYGNKNIIYRYADTWSTGNAGDWVTVSSYAQTDYMIFNPSTKMWVTAKGSFYGKSIGGKSGWSGISDVPENFKAGGMCFGNGKLAISGSLGSGSNLKGGGIALFDEDGVSPAWDPSVTDKPYCPRPEFVVEVDLDTNSLVVEDYEGSSPDRFQIGDTYDLTPSIYYGTISSKNTAENKLLVQGLAFQPWLNNDWPDSDNRLGTDLYLIASSSMESVLERGIVPLESTPFKANPEDTLAKIIWEIDGVEHDAGTANPYTPAQLAPGGHTVRVKHIGTTSGESAWSPPAQFVTGGSTGTYDVSIAEVTREVMRQIAIRRAGVGTTDLVEELADEVAEDEAN